MDPHIDVSDPLAELGRWIEEARAAGLPQPGSVAFVTADGDLFHQLQTMVSRQGEPIDDLASLRDRLDHLAQVQETAPACPPDWGALRVRPDAIELWSEADDRIHERRLFERGGGGWTETLLSP